MQGNMKGLYCHCWESLELARGPEDLLHEMLIILHCPLGNELVPKFHLGFHIWQSLRFIIISGIMVVSSAVASFRDNSIIMLATG